MEIELPTKITEIIAIAGTCIMIISLLYRSLREINMHMHSVIETLKLFDRRLTKVEEDFATNNKSTQASFKETNQTITDIKIITAKLDVSLESVKDTMHCYRLSRDQA
jgi:hypothetical protein